MVKMMSKKAIYIAGPITGVENYWVPFMQAEDDLTAYGLIPINPVTMPEGLSPAQYMRVCFAMIDAADGVLLLPGYDTSKGAMLEKAYAEYIKKPVSHNIENLKRMVMNDGKT